MGVGASLYMYNVVVKSSRSLSHRLMSFLCSKPANSHWSNGPAAAQPIANKASQTVY